MKLSPEGKKIEKKMTEVKSDKKKENETHMTLLKKPSMFDGSVRPNPAEFAALVAREIVKNLQSIPAFRSKVSGLPKDLHIDAIADIPAPEGQNLILVDTSILIDGRIVSVVNSGFLAGTLLIPQFVLHELQHIADSSDALKRAKGRRGLEVVQKLILQKTNEVVVTKIIQDNVIEITEVDHKLVALAKQWKTKLVTVDFNLAQISRAEGVKVLNIHDLAQAVRLSIIPGEDMIIKITHEGKERQQGVGYLPDGTMIIVDDARDKVGIDVHILITRVVNTPAGQIFFARLK